MKKCNKNGAILFDYLNFAKTAGLTKDAELITRRLLDILWISDSGRFANDPDAIFRAIGRGYTRSTFKKHWNAIIVDADLFDISESGRWIYCDAIIAVKDKVNGLSKKRSTAGRKGGRPKQKPAPAPVPNTPDEKGTISGDPGRRSGAVSKGGFFDEIKRQNSEAGLSDAARRRLKGDE